MLAAASIYIYFEHFTMYRGDNLNSCLKQMFEQSAVCYLSQRHVRK